MAAIYNFVMITAPYNSTDNYFQEHIFCNTNPSTLHLWKLIHNNDSLIAPEMWRKSVGRTIDSDLQDTRTLNSTWSVQVFTYVILENGQTHNTQQESSDSEDYEYSIASSDINNSSGPSQDEAEPEFETTLPQLSRFALSGTWHKSQALRMDTKENLISCHKTFENNKKHKNVKCYLKKPVLECLVKKIMYTWYSHS